MNQHTMQQKFMGLSFLLVAMLGIVPYIIYAVVYPELPLEGLLLYRKDGDFSYFPQIRALADGTIGEAILPEHLGEGIRSFPFAALAIHGLCFRMFGPIGLIVADSLIYLLYYSCLRGFFQVLGIKRFMAALVSLAIILLLPFHYQLRTMLPKPLLLLFWGFRFPRPFVTEIFLLGSIVLTLSLFSDPHIFRRRHQWIFLAIVLALLVQADIYPAITMLLHVGFLVAGTLLCKKQGRMSFLRFAPFIFMTGTICGLPFLIQRIAENPDIPRRFGVFTVSRLPLHILDGSVLRFILVLAAGGGLLELLHRIKTDSSASKHHLMILSLVGICAFLAQPVSLLILGKTIQPYHFALQFDTVTSYSLLGFLIIACQLALRISPFRAILRSPRIFAILLAAIIGIQGILYIKTFPALSRKHLRFDYQAYNTLPNYRHNFSRLLHELTRPPYAGYDMLATLDVQVFAWWTTFVTGHAFLTDPFHAAVSDAVIEERLIQFCHLCGMTSADQFAAFIQQPYVNIWWLGHNKYQASKAHTYAPLDEYPEHIQRAIHEEPWGVWYGCWRLYVPVSEQARLKQKFDTLSLDDVPLPDIIVLTKSDLDFGLRPSEALFTQGYTNEVFVVYTRRETQQARKWNNFPEMEVMLLDSF